MKPTPMQARIISEHGLDHINGIVTEPCARCHGSGHYSYNSMDGTRCFKCRGSRVQHVKLETVISRIRKAELATKRRNDALELENRVVIDVPWSDLIEAAREYKARLRAAEATKMSHFGEVGGKIDVELRFVRCAGFDGYYGWVNIYRFEDVETGSAAVWFTQSTTDINNNDHEGRIVRVRASVKEHGEYNDQPQTKLTRCKLELIG